MALSATGPGGACTHRKVIPPREPKQSKPDFPNGTIWNRRAIRAGGVGYSLLMMVSFSGETIPSRLRKNPVGKIVCMPSSREPNARQICRRMNLQAIALVKSAGRRLRVDLLRSTWIQRSVAALLFFAGAQGVPVHGAHVGFDSFDYPDGSIAGRSGGGLWDWNNFSGVHTGRNSDWDTVSGSPTIQNGALVTLGSAALREYNGPGERLPNTTDEGVGAVNELNTQKVVYYRVRMTRSAGAERSTVASLDFGVERVSFGVFSTGTALGIEVGASRNFSFVIPQPGQTYTLVAKIDYPGNKLRLFVDPDLYQGEPATASVEVSYPDTFWSTAVQLAGTGAGATTWDDLAVATSWEGVRYPVMVTTAADPDTGAGFQAASATVSLRQAIRQSSTNGYISFAPFLNGQTIRLLHGEIAITNSVILDGGGLPNGITISGEGASRIFQIKGGATTAVLYQLTLTKGTGGAIYGNSAGTLGLNGCTLFGNSGSSGGAIYNSNTELYLNQCTLVGNAADEFGGAICNLQDNSPKTCTLRNCTVAGNSGGIGGGLYTQGAVTLQQCIVAGNSALTPTFHPDVDIAIGPLTALGVNLIGINSGGFPAGTLGGTSQSPLQARLAPLGNYGGPTLTCPPLAGSPAINAAGTVNPGGTDQRGLPRFVGGALDIGAVESVSIEIQNLADSGPGSLRAAIASAPAYALIEFSPALSGQRLPLAGTELLIDKPVAISAASLPGGLILDAGRQSRLFRFTTNAVGASLDSLTLTGGQATGDGVHLGTYLGGAILNEGSVSIYNSTLHGNSAGRGGAIYNGAGDGALRDIGARLLLRNSTVAENAAVEGGGLYNLAGSYELNHATISRNAALGGPLPDQNYFGNGGGIAGASSRQTIHHNSIVAGNSARDGRDILTALVAFTCTGKNLLGPNSRSAELDPAAVISVTDPLLLPLGRYGGPTPTLHPRQSSPAIDAAGPGVAVGTDQRGLPRLVNGALDIGAVEAGPALVVSSAADNVAGSLRQAVATANLAAGQRIVFSPSMAAASLQLVSGQLTITQSVILDASLVANPAARTVLDAQGLSRILEVGAGASVALDSLVLTRGMATDAGGGIRNLGTLTVNNCSFVECSAPMGGGIYNLGDLDLQNSTFDRNQADTGAGLYTDTDLNTLQTVVKNCTFARNQALVSAGAIYNYDGRATVLQCTISSNTAPVNGVGGIGGFGDALTPTTMGSTILAANTGGDVGLVGSTEMNSFQSSGHNLVGGGNAVAAFNGSGDVRGVRDPRLLPLANYGGPTATMHPASGSPAIDAGGPVNPGGTDQRGFIRFVGSALDIGAVEAVFGPQLPYLAVTQLTNQLEVNFDLFDPETQFLQVRMEFSRDAGATWAVATNATGALGSSVERGTRRKILWNVLPDLGPVFTTQLRVRLLVTGHGPQPTVASSDNLTMDTRPRTVLVKGRVVDTLGNPVAGAAVTINALPSVVTAADGGYSVANVPRAGGTLIASKAIYSPQTRTLSSIAGITEQVLADITLTRLAFQVSDITRDVEGIYLGGDFSFDVRATAHIDWGGRTRGSVRFYLGSTLLQTVQNPVGDEATITFNTASLASGLLPYSTVELRAEAVASNNEVSRSAQETLQFVGAAWMDALPFQAQQVSGREPRYIFSAKWPVEIAEALDLGVFGDLGVDLSANLGMVYAPRSGEWELWLGDADQVRSNWRPRSFGDDDAGGFVIGGERLSLDTRAFASGLASSRGLGFNQLNVQSTLSFNQRLGELCVTDFIPGSSGAVRGIGGVLESAGFDFNSLQCVRFDLDVYGTLRLAATAPTGQLRFQDGSFTAGGTLSGYYKPELGRLVELLAKISGGVDLTLGVPNFEYRETTVRAVAEFKAATTIPFLPNLSYETKWVLLDETFPRGQGGGGAFAVASAGGGPERSFRALEVASTRILSGLPSIASGEVFVANDAQPLARPAGDTEPVFQAASQPGGSSQTNQILVQNVFTNSHHALAARGQEMLLVYSRPQSPASQELVWMRFDGTSWSAPAVVPGAVSAAILQPTIAYDGNGTAVVVWQQFASTPAPGADVAAVTGTLELGWARYAGGTWTPAQSLTSNLVYDGEPALRGTLPNGDLLLVWRQALPGESFATRGAISSRRWNRATQTWAAPELVDNVFTGTSDFACASGAGKVVLVWSADADQNYGTTADSELYYRIWANGSWGAAVQSTADSVADRTPRVAIDENGTVFLAWVRNEQLVFSTNFAAPAVVPANPGTPGLSGLQLSIGPTQNPLLFWQETFGLGSDGRYAVYDSAAGLWGQSAPLWKDADAERGVVIAWDDSGRLALAYLKERLVATTQEVVALDINGSPVTLTLSNVTETASVDLAFTRKALQPNLTLSKLAVADENFLPGNIISLSATLENTGDRAVLDPRVQFKFRPNNVSPEIVISNITVSGWMPAQTTQHFTATWVLPANIDRGRIVAVADPLGAIVESDESALDNEKSLERGGSDLVVALKSKTVYPNRTARIVGSVFNAGAPASFPFPGTFRMRRSDGIVVASAALPSVPPGDTIEIALDLPAGFQTNVFATYTLEADAVQSGDTDPFNNTARFSIEVSPEYLDPIPVTNGLQLHLTADAGTSTTANGAPVASWIDRQNGHEFTNANALRPTYVADSGGGQPAIDFTRNSGFVGSFASTAGATIGDATIFVIGRFAGYAHPAGSASYFYSIDSATGGSEPTLGRQQRAGTGPDALFHNRGQPAQATYFGTNIVEDPAGAFTLYTARFRSAASGGGMDALINLQPAQLVNISGSPDSGYEADPSKTRIGLSTANDNGLDGMIREVIIYNRILAPQEMTALHAYLLRRTQASTAPVILAQPSTTGGCVGGSASFSASTDLSTATFQWQRRLPGANAFENIPGATSGTYGTPTLAPGDDGSVFRVIVSGNGTSVISGEAMLSVISFQSLTAFYDFDGQTLENAAIFGAAYIDEELGVLELNPVERNQSGAFLTTDLAPAAVVEGFAASFQARVAAGSSPPADGFSFNWATNLPAGTYQNAEQGVGSGLRVTFDTFSDTAIEVLWADQLVARRYLTVPELVRGPDFFPVQIRLTPDGRLDVTYACEPIFSRLPIPGYAPQRGARFGIAGRTGAAFESHGIDNLALELYFDPASVPGRITSIQRQLPFGLQINGRGAPGRSYPLEASTDLSHWTRHASVTTDAAGLWQWVEASVATPPYRFYRLGRVVPALYNTGQNDAGLPLAAGATDPHYQLVTNPDSASTSAVVHDDIFPVDPNGPWLANTATSQWLSSRPDSLEAAGGDYVYRTTVDLTGRDLSRVRLAGRWSSDNSSQIRVNGATTVSVTGVEHFFFWTPFTLDSTTAQFVNGVNTIDFIVNNAASGPTGLRVEFTEVIAP